MILIQQYFETQDIIRNNEIQNCLKNNIKNKYIKEIHLLNEQNYKVLDKKVKCINLKQRLSYQEAFKYANNLGSNKTIIVANSDIYFNDTLKILDKWNNYWNDKIICLTRHELDIEKRIVNHREVKPFFYKNTIISVQPKWSHDVWIFKTPIKEFECNFQLGTMHCENLLVINARDNGIECINGYPYIQAIHNHNSYYRTYNPQINSRQITEMRRKFSSSYLTKDILGRQLF